MKVIAVAIQKGGTGKTTTAAALAWAGSAKGLRVLAIDLDPQKNLSYTLGATATGGGAYSLITGQPPESLIQATEQGPDVIPATADLSTITTGRGSARRLQQALDPIRDQYDLIIIDTPPTAGELQYNALQAADGLIIPLEAFDYDYQSLHQITDTARQIMQTNPALTIIGCVITRYDGRATINRQTRDIIRAEADKIGVPYLGTIRQGVAIREAVRLQKPLFKYARRSNVAQDYMELFDTITAQEV